MLDDSTDLIPVKKIRKKGPFEITLAEGGPAFFAGLIASALAQVDELPDFSDDKGLVVMTDFGGEHPEALNHTYSFLIASQTKLGPFEHEVGNMRHRHNLLTPYSEFSYKRVGPGPKGRALPEFLAIVDRLLHGAIITIAIDKRVGSVFGEPRKSAHAEIVRQLAEMDLGVWKGPDAEKMLRVSHIMAALLSVLAQPDHKLFWYCDDDAINAEGNLRTFVHTKTIFAAALSMYKGSQFELVGIGKSFEKKGHLDDLLSFADMAAGVISDILDGHTRQADISGKDEKIHVIKWIAQPSTHLSKIVIQIAPLPEGGVGSGVIKITPK